MEISDYINKWICSDTIYWKDNFQEIDNLKYIMEDDRTFARSKFHYIFGKCIGITGKFLVIYNKKGILRIEPNLIKFIYPSSKFEWNDFVQEVKRPEIKGKIEDIIWHLKDQEYKYFISINGKMKSRRYDSGELVITSTLGV